MAAESSLFIGLCEYLNKGLWEGQRSCIIHVTITVL